MKYAVLGARSGACLGIRSSTSGWRLFLPVLAACGMWLGSPFALAQDEPPRPDTSAEDAADAPIALEDEPAARALPKRAQGQLDEIIVTAQKRAESQQETPISLATMNADALEKLGVDGLADLDGKVPGLSLEPFPTSNATLQLYIRGVGIIDSQVTQDPPIGIYYDGIYISRSVGAALDIADVERIEVLRGPQGTLYGRNTTGGAVNIVTKKPQFDGFSMRHKLTTGGRGQLIGKTSFNIPVTGNLAIKPALLYTQQDGFMDNTGPGGDFSDRDSHGQRLDLRWLISDRWMLDYGFDNSHIGYYNMAYQAQLTPERDKGTADLIKRPAQERSRYGANRLNALATGAPLEQSTVDIRGHGLSLEGQFEHFTLKYLASLRDLDEGFYTDLGGGAGSTEYRLDTHAYDGPAADVANGGPVDLMIPAIAQTQSSHELQIVGSGLNGTLDYVAGIYFFEESAVEDWPFHHQLSAPLDPDQIASLDMGLLSGSEPRLVGFARRHNEIRNTARALYGQLSWSPEWLPRTRLTLGYRRSEDKRFAQKNFFADNYIEMLGPGGAGTATLLGLPDSPVAGDEVAANDPFAGERFDNVQGRLRFDNDSWSVIGEYQWLEQVNLYAKYVEAYKSGGFNIRDPQVSGESGPASDGVDYGYGFVEGFQPELVSTVELGLKSEWFDRRLRLNGDVFYTDYTDMQINFLVAGTVIDTKSTNAGKAAMQGLEMDLTWLATSDILLSASGAYLDAEITRVINVEGENVADEFQFNSAPKYSGTLAADWTFLRRSWGDAHLNLSWILRDERKGGARTGAPLTLPAYDVLDIRLSLDGMHLSGGELKLALWARNLLDEEYEINAIDNLPHADRASLWGEPRQIGLDLIFSQ